VDVGEWLKSLGLEQYEAAFRENDVDAELLFRLTADDLNHLGITPSSRIRRFLRGSTHCLSMSWTKKSSLQRPNPFRHAP